MSNRIWCTSWPLALAGSLYLLAIPVVQGLIGEASRVCPLSPSEMLGAVGLQTAGNDCHQGTAQCSGQTTESGCMAGCLRCTESTATEMVCGAMAGLACTTDPDIACGEETQGHCHDPADCCEDPCPCNWSPIVTGPCGTMIGQCHIEPLPDPGPTDPGLVP